MTTQICRGGWTGLGEFIKSSLRQEDVEALMLCPDVPTQESAWSIISVSITGFQLQSRIRGLLQSHAELCDNIRAPSTTLTIRNSEFTIRKILWSLLICTIQLVSQNHKSDVVENYIDLVAKLQRPVSSAYTLATSGAVMMPKVAEAIEEALSCIATFLCSSFKFFRLRRHDKLAGHAWKQLENVNERTEHDVSQKLSHIKTKLRAGHQRRTDSQMTEILKRLETINTSNTPQISLRILPFPQNPRFFGRKTELSQIDKLLRVDDSSASSSQKAVALYGIGGVGKTQIALQYAYINTSSWSVILWVSAVSKLQLAEEYHRIAVRAGLVATSNCSNVESSRQLVLDWLASLHESWLLIFDNVDEEAELETYWPSGPQGAIIMTTRNPLLTMATTSIGIEPFSTAEGSAFLYSLIAKVPGTRGSDHDSEAISNRLGGLPLAINQMAAFILSRAMSLDEFRKMYEKFSQKYNGIARPGSTFYYKYTINSTWELSLSKLSRDSKALLQILSFFQPDGIPVEVLRPLSSDTATGAVAGAPNGEEEISEAIGGLVERALIKRVGEIDSYVMHRLVKETTYKNMDKVECLQAYKTAVYLANSIFPKQNAGTLMVKHWPECERYLRQVLTLVSHYGELKQELTPLSDLAELTSNAAWYMDERGLGHHALDLIQVGLENCGSAKTPVEAHLHNTAGTIYSVQNKSDLALNELHMTKDIYESLYGKDDLTVAGAYNNIANILTANGEYEAALSMHRKAVDIRQQPHETRDITLGQSFGNIAHCHYLSGQIEAAKETVQKSITLWEEHYGRYSMPVAKLLYLEGNICRAAGDLYRALQVHNEVLGIRKDILGQHEATAASHYKIACILEQQGEYINAEDHLRQSIEACGNDEAIAGSRARGMYRRAMVLTKLGRDEEANEEKTKAGKLRESAFGIPLDERDSQESYDSLIWLNYR
ncbi:uncharacterized protein F4807DRAFT_471225 [Annulohypoxylon truncatum]|uniref:uncharacterized protein n=1 Tax=Annulohypoxylon truncatum TaxID=327061 RepID=UPI002007F46E|nr:uncharacterized protein F4807DRAFT_471225 [Annulohypoxylon truncatum]KAI1205232.1 hypothetical protein F4807DRAFT_471225 [Annulohypoxylon truncatum]